MLRQSVILFGTGARFSIAVLSHLLAHGLKPAVLALPGFAPAVLKDLDGTQVDVSGEVNQFVLEAKRLSIPLIYLPESSQVSQAEKIAAVKADYILLACWPYMLSPEIISTAGKASLNLHPSILPNYRGADPVTAQIDNEEKNLGVSLHLLNQEFDQGDIVGQASLELGTKSPGCELIEAQAARIGTNLFMKAMQDFGSPAWRPRPQCI